MEKSIPWMEKYRPQDINKLVLSSDIKKQIDIILQKRINSHLIISGTPGIGKTSTARCIAKYLLGSYFNSGYLEINAAEAKGAKGVSSMILPFCKKNFPDDYPRIIFFDEADNINRRTQRDINDLLKQFGEKIRFIFTCNNSAKIIEDIQSGCRIIHYKSLTIPQIVEYLEYICVSEKVQYDKDGLQTIANISKGDMRKAINNLQKTAYSYDNITESIVLYVCKIPNPVWIEEIISVCMKKDLCRAEELTSELVDKGYHYMDVINSFVFVLTRYQLDEDLRLKLISTVKQSEITASLGLRSNLQLSAMVCKIVLVIMDNHK